MEKSLQDWFSSHGRIKLVLTTRDSARPDPEWFYDLDAGEENCQTFGLDPIVERKERRTFGQAVLVDNVDETELENRLNNIETFQRRWAEEKKIEEGEIAKFLGRPLYLRLLFQKRPTPDASGKCSSAPT